MFRNLIFIIMLAFGLTGAPVQAHHTALPADMSEVEATWLWGNYAIPAVIARDNSPYWYSYPHTDVNKIKNPAWTEVAAKHIKPGVKVPAVLLLHGCSGLARGPAQRRVFFLQHGYAIFEPDSFARPGRTCNQLTLSKRTEEIEYALRMMQSLPWVDHRHIILMGISQGGAAAAVWHKSGFSAHIIFASNCSGLRPKAPAGIPVLAVIGEKDKWTQGCIVDQKVNGSKSMVLPGEGHDFEFPEKAMEAFITTLEAM